MKITITKKIQPLGATGFIYTISDVSGNFICTISDRRLQRLFPLLELKVDPDKVLPVEQIQLYQGAIVWGKEKPMEYISNSPQEGFFRINDQVITIHRNQKGEYGCPFY
jgi:hypothetical protein